MIPIAVFLILPVVIALSGAMRRHREDEDKESLLIKDVKKFKFFTDKHDTNYECECKCQLTKMEIINPVLGVKCPIKNVESNTDDELLVKLGDLLNRNEEYPISVLNFLIKFIRNDDNKNKQYFSCKYCNNCHNVYDDTYIVKKKFLGLTYNRHCEYKTLLI